MHRRTRRLLLRFGFLGLAVVGVDVASGDLTQSRDHFLVVLGLDQGPSALLELLGPNRRHLNQILFLLLDNAAKFTSDGTIEIGVEVLEDRLSCEIRDSGIGICPDDQQFIFDEFYQVDALSSNKYRGAGLGLALVRDLLNLLDGEMSLSSDVGRGTTVTFHVPVEVVG